MTSLIQPWDGWIQESLMQPWQSLWFSCGWRVFDLAVSNSAMIKPKLESFGFGRGDLINLSSATSPILSWRCRVGQSSIWPWEPLWFSHGIAEADSLQVSCDASLIWLWQSLVWEALIRLWSRIWIFDYTMTISSRRVLDSLRWTFWFDYDLQSRSGRVFKLAITISPIWRWWRWVGES